MQVIERVNVKLNARSHHATKENLVGMENLSQEEEHGLELEEWVLFS